MTRDEQHKQGEGHSQGYPWYGFNIWLATVIYVVSVCFRRKTYYEILGVPKSATQKDIKEAYFELSKQVSEFSLSRFRVKAHQSLFLMRLKIILDLVTGPQA